MEETMRKFLNSRGVAFIPFLLGVGMIFGISAVLIEKHWNDPAPEAQMEWPWEEPEIIPDLEGE